MGWQLQALSEHWVGESNTEDSDFKTDKHTTPSVEIAETSDVNPQKFHDSDTNTCEQDLRAGFLSHHQVV